MFLSLLNRFVERTYPTRTCPNPGVLRLACITGLLTITFACCQTAAAQRFGSRGIRGGGVGIGISISPMGISIGRTAAPYRSPVPVNGLSRAYGVPRSYGAVSAYRVPVPASPYGRSYGVTPYTRGGVTISRAVPVSPSYRSVSPYGSRSLYPSTSITRSSTAIVVPRTSSGYRAVSPYSTSPYSSSRLGSSSPASGSVRTAPATPSMSIPAYRPPEPPTMRSRMVRAEAIPSALRDAASRLRRSLQNSRESQVWLNYLKPDQIVSTIDAGGSITGLKDLLGGYNGVSNNRELSYVYNADGFSEIRGLLGRIDEYEQAVADPGYANEEASFRGSSILDSEPMPIGPVDRIEVDRNRSSENESIELVPPPIPDGPAELPPAVPDSVELKSL